MKKIFLISLALCFPVLLCAQGTLTAYYANADFGNYKQGQLIVDTNDPINRMVDYSASKYKYEGDDTGEYYSNLILKSRVTVKTYEMSPLPVELVKDDAVFASRDGFVVRIFTACANGHLFYRYDDDFNLLYDEYQTKEHREFFVLSGRLKSPYLPEGFFFEEPLTVKGSTIMLYVDASQTYAVDDDPSNVRYRSNKLGFLEQHWTKPEEYDYDKSAYDADGNLLVDLQPVDGIPDYISIAYIGAEDALYINGTLYYRQ